MEDFAERTARLMVEGVKEADVIKRGADHMRSKNTPFALAQWATRDGVHRGRLRMHALDGWARL
jgi:hypothetical protein